MKTCYKCRKEQEESEFYSNKARKSGISDYCKSCCREQSLDWKRRNPDRWIKQTYGVSKEYTDNLFYQQEQCCAICGAWKDIYGKKGNSLVIDHCHSSGLVRGLLCNPCNVMLGQAKDDTTILGKAIVYLNSYK